MATRREFLYDSAAAVAASALANSRWSIAASTPVAAPNSMPIAAVAPRAPLQPVPFLALPLGSIRARGWLLKQLELQRDGLTGHADKVLPSLTSESSAWLNRGQGEGEGWEKGPYYVKGLVPLAFTLGDERLVAKATEWVEAIFASQQSSGFFGPLNNNDWWPRMVATYLLRDFHEATGDERVLPFLARYYRHQQQELPNRPLADWGRARAGDEIETAIWLYNRGGDEGLLDLMDLLARQAYPWQQIHAENRFLDFGVPQNDFHPKHAVNVPQALKMPPVYWQRSGRAADRAAYRQALTHLMRDHGTSLGINTGTEMLSGYSTVEGVELCAIVENMLSAETTLRILGEGRIADELEMVAFNGLPAAMSKAFRQHVYYTLSNNVSATRGGDGYEIDYVDGRTPAPRSGCPCCCYNLHMGWPKLVQNSWAATPTGGLALLAYVPTEVTARVKGDAVAHIVCRTDYPFRDSIQLTIDIDRPSRFPLHLRTPGWCTGAIIRVNGEAQQAAKPGEFIAMDRLWSPGDRVDLSFAMKPQVVTNPRGVASVRRGPLVMSLAMEEKWSAFEQGALAGFESFEVTSPTPWNYALDLGSELVDSEVGASSLVDGADPFATGEAPVVVTATAKRVEQWQVRPDGHLALDPPTSPVVATTEAETIKLVPFGSQMLRVTDFPVLGESPPTAPEAWESDFARRFESDWIVYHGGFVRDGRLHLVRGSKGVAIRTDFDDLAIEAEIHDVQGGDAGLMFRVSAPSVGVDAYRGYYVGIHGQTGDLVFGKADYRWIPLEQKPKVVAPKSQVRLRVEARGPEISVWVNDAREPALTARDEAFVSGAVGVRAYAALASFSRVAARRLG